MGRIINSDDNAKERRDLIRGIVIALRQLNEKQDFSQESLDLLAFISLSLSSLYTNADTSVSAWEKRGYWIKADRFRLEWEWSDRYAIKLRDQIINQDWNNIPLTLTQIAQKVIAIKIPQRMKIDSPWVGSLEKLQSEK